MEKLLHYVWKHKILPLKALMTTDGRDLEIIDPGLHNSNAGPDFFNAKIRIGKTVWAGNVEIHLKSSDWYQHGHHLDPAYNNTILHVARTVNCDVKNSDDKDIPQLQLDIPAQLAIHYQELQSTEDYPRCHKMIPELEKMKIHGWMDSLLIERLAERSQKVLNRVKETNGDWEQAAFVTLCRNFGFGLNGDTFENWAKLIPLHAVNKHRDNLVQIEAIFLGLAGLIEECDKQKSNDEIAYLKQEFAYLSRKFSLPDPIDSKLWKYLRTHPQNFPHTRILQIASLYQSGKAQFSSLIEAENLETLQKALQVKGTSANSRNLLIINTVVPLLYAYGTNHNERIFQECAIRLLEEMPAENNYILRQWKACGLDVKTAADSQALIQLKKEYCDRLDCLRCRFGYEYLKR